MTTPLIVPDVPMTPSKGPGVKSLIGSQAGNRYTDTFHDQHRFSQDARRPWLSNGRPWCGPREMAAIKGNPDGFLGSLQPGEYVATGPDDNRHIPTQTPEDRMESFRRAWSAPWSPEDKYFEFHWRIKRIQIRYDRVSSDYTMEYRNYYRAANKIAVQKGWAELPLGVAPTFQIVSALGDLNPMHSPRLPTAAQAGDLWVLGFSPEVNTELANLLNVVTDSFDASVFTRAVPIVAPVARVEEVLATPDHQMAALVERLLKQNQEIMGELADMKAKKAKNGQQLAKARAARKTPASEPAE